MQLPQVINRKVGYINSNINFIATFSGEGKTAYTVMREEHTDVKAFPKHHPSGRFGLNHPRNIRLSQQMYFNQRLLNQDKRFAKDPCYLFMASYYIERQAVERQRRRSARRSCLLGQTAFPSSRCGHLLARQNASHLSQDLLAAAPDPS